MRKLLGVLLVLAGLAALAIFFLAKKTNAVLDAAEVERIAAGLLPGARPPDGLKGVLAVHPEGLQAAIFAPGLPQAKAENLGPGQLNIIIARPESSQPPQPGEVLSKIAQAQQEQAESFQVLSKHPVLLRVGGLQQPALESQLQVKGSSSQLRQDFAVVLVNKHPVILILTGGEPGFNQTARDEFLSGIAPPERLPNLPKAPDPPAPAKVAPPKPPRPGLPGPPPGPPRPPGM